MLKQISFLAVALLIGTQAMATNAAPIKVMECSPANADTDKKLVLYQHDLSEQDQPNRSFTLELFQGSDRSAKQAVLRLDASQVFWGPSLIAIDAFESRVGTLRLVSMFRVGSSQSEKVDYQAEYRRAANNSGSYGLDKLSNLAVDGLDWICQK